MLKKRFKKPLRPATQYDRGNFLPTDPFKDNDDLYRSHKSDISVKQRKYVIKKTWRLNWDDALVNLFKNIFGLKRR